MSKVGSRIEKKDIILILIILILIIVMLVLFVKTIMYPKTTTQVPNYTPKTTRSAETGKKVVVQVPQTDDEIIKMLADNNRFQERDRIEYYCGEYFKHLENKEFDKAYDLLYPEFKNKYFPTLEEYKAYIERTYPADYAFIYDDISRQGDIYVLRLKICDVLGSRENEKIQRVVIRENNYNDFVLSFQVI